MRKRFLSSFSMLIFLAVFFLTPLKLVSSDLEDAIYNNNYREVEKLIKSGANVNEEDTYEYTPIWYASGFEVDINIFNLLIKAGAKPTSLALSKAIKYYSDEHIKNSKPKYFNSLEKIKILLKNGAITDHPWVYNDLKLSYNNLSHQEFISLTKLLMQYGFNINKQYDRSYFLQFVDINTFHELIKLGANASQYIEIGQVSWFYCKDNGVYNDNCINQLQITFTNDYEFYIKSMTIRVTIKSADKKQILYSQQHNVQVNLKRRETGPSKPFLLNQGVRETNYGFSDPDHVNIYVEVLSIQ